MRFTILRPRAKNLKLRRSLPLLRPRRPRRLILNKASVYLHRTARGATERMPAVETVLIFAVFQPD